MFAFIFAKIFLDKYFKAQNFAQTIKGILVNHHSLKSRFRAALTGALLVLPSHQREKISGAVEIAIISQTKFPVEPLANQELDIWTKVCQAIALGLFWHQDVHTLSKVLSSYVATPEHLILAYAIALCCRDALYPRNLIGHICAYLPKELEEELNAESLKTLIQQLRLAQDLVDRGQSGVIARHTLHQPIAYGLYCFLSTPHHWGLATKRTQQMNPIIGASIGAIAGAYQGQVPAEYTDEISSGILETGRQMGDRLLAAWAGVYDLSPIQDLAEFSATITAPNILKRRI
ncbi:hypothetical protein V2H45_09515 [Tumidithrix elongata RA019]|uniref:ADP-ribosylglycohydrolase n=1 Tax=Tumidithrix elongata BACA0141 TaxID=2716417 RepID=A0AAW9PVZ5_9CYAN|nr:hypothetical protein [Tumidithrix elongata RA019]